MTTVLLVDDHQELLDMVQFGLSHRGYEIITALDGEAGLQAAVDHQPDCIVIDVKMPGLNGNQLVLVLRGDPATAQIPLVMLTALAQDKDQFASMASGADQYLIKPQTPSAIAEAIERALALSAAERATRMRSLADAPEAAS